MTTTPSFTIYNASAGSGKTYTLTKEYLKIILAAAQNDAYQKILAITFTNKAVEEMKSRVLQSLFDFSKKDTPPNRLNLIQELSVETGLSIATIKEKSKEIIKHIIHNYSAFGISTIDKFTHKVIRSFAQDLDLPSNFEVVLDTETLLQEAVDLVISKVGEEEELTRFLVDFAKTKTDEDKNWDISKELLEISKLLINENDAQEVNLFQEKTLADFKQIKTALEHEIIKLKDTGKQLGKQLKEFILSKGIALESFQVYFVNHLHNIENDEVKSTQKKYWEPEDIKVKKNAKDLTIIDAIKSDILSQLAKVYSLYGKIDFYEAILQNISPLTLLNTIQQEFKKIQQEQNVLSISDFNKILFNEIQDQPAPFIYERLGEKYRHYFIDEFQDTSIMQWRNLIPLIDNALASEENGIKGTLMLVGDPKQSIYRWRGGKAEQFIALSKEENPFSNKDKQVQDLDTNYRSYSEIVSFNNTFFKTLASKFENEDYADLYLNHSFQKTNTKKGGYVNISFIEELEDENPAFDEDSDYTYKTLCYLEKTLATIKNVRENGFQYSEIVLLTRKTKDGISLANYLTENNIPILSSETLLIQNATEVKLIIALLRYLKNHKDLESKAYVLYYVGRYFQTELPIHDFIATYKDATEEELEKVFQNLGITISFQNSRTKSLYEAVEQMITAFIKEKTNTSYILYFLDLVLEKDSKTQSSIADFLDYWDSVGFKKSIPSPEGADAVRIMTIHKSKGLEFPVVIFPFAEEDFSKNMRNKIWLDFEENSIIDLPKALVNAKKDIENYNEKAKTLYFQKNQEELLDIINILYVVLTRAEEQLYIISNKKKTKKGDWVTNNLSYFFIEFLINKGLFSEDNLNYDFGNPKRVSPNPYFENVSKTIQLVKEKLSFQNIKIAKREALLWGTIQSKSINFGNVVHEILSFINSKKDIELALTKAIENGLIVNSEIKQMTSVLNEIVQNKELFEFFDEEGKVFNESVIIDQTLGNIKPNRVVIKENRAYLLDYKTGKPKESHINQINQYAITLEKMKFEVVKKVLVYIGETIEVVLL